MKFFIAALNTNNDTPTPDKTPFTFNYVKDGISSVVGELDGVLAESYIKTSTITSINDSTVMEYSNFALNGDSSLKQTSPDNAGPVNIIDFKTVAGHHAWQGGIATISGHDKQTVDLGSIWELSTDTSIKAVLIHISGNVLWLIRYSSPTNSVPSGVYNHTSGATNTSSINFTTGLSTRQFFPVYSNYSLRIFIDNVEISTAISNTFNGSNNVRFLEKYDVLESKSILDNLITRVGGTDPDLYKSFNGTSLMTIETDNYLDAYGRLTSYIEYHILGDINNNNFLYLAPFQQIGLTDQSTNNEFYIPKTIPFTESAQDFDFANKETVRAAGNGFPDPTNLTTGRWEFPTSPPNRFVQLNWDKSMGFSCGHLPLNDSADANLIQTTNIPIGVNSAPKFYTYGVNNSGISPLQYPTQGTKYNFVTYRNSFIINNDRTDLYFIEDYKTGDYYMFADWHTAKTDFIPIDTLYRGRYITLVEKSSNVSFSSSVLGSTLSVTITNDKTYGFLVLKLTNTP